MTLSLIIHYIKSACRELVRFKLNTTVNLLGITLGICAFLVIGIYVRYETGYDRYHKNVEDTYRLTCSTKDENSDAQNWAMTPSAYPGMFKETFPEVENSARVLRSADHNLVYDENKFKTHFIVFADSTFLDILEYPLALGNPKAALSGTNQIILTHETAQKLFGNEDPLNRIVSVYSDRGELQCNVTGVLKKDLPPTHLDFEAILSYDGAIKLWGDGIDQNPWFIRVFNYFKLKEGTKKQVMVDKFNACLREQLPDIAAYMTFDLQPVASIHLNSDLMFDTKNGNKSSVYWLGVIGILVLVMACVNFINLTSTEAIKYHKKVAISKLLGAAKYALFFTQFIKAVVLLTIAAAISVLTIWLLLPTIGNIVDINLSLQAGLISFIIKFTLLIILLTGVLIGGISTAITRITQSDINISVLKRGNGIVKPLVVFQFLITIVLISGTIVIYKQFKYINQEDLGYSIDNKIVAKAPTQYAAVANDFSLGMKTFKNEALKLPGVELITSSYVVPGQEVPWDYITQNVNNENKEVGINMNFVDYDYFDGYEHKLLAGKFFSKHEKTTTEGILLNKQAIDFLGYKSPDDAINKTINLNGNQLRIVGVFDNHHQLSFKHTYTPFYLKFQEFGKSNYTFCISGSDQKATYNNIKELWEKHFPHDPFDGVYLTDFYNAQHKKEHIFSRVFNIFCILSIFISVLGIFILSVSTTQQKTKEIGVRKVNGATVSEILVLLNQSFVKWVIVAFIIATPVSYYAMHNWLESFAFKTTLSWWVFALAGVAALGIALITVSWQSWRAATQNPVEALRYE